MSCWRTWLEKNDNDHMLNRNIARMPRVILVLSERDAETVKGMLIYVSNWVILRFIENAILPSNDSGL